jgi:hypothetical protein
VTCDIIIIVFYLPATNTKFWKQALVHILPYLACSEAGFSSQNGDRAWGVRYLSTALFCGQKYSIQRVSIKKCFVFTVGSVCHVKRFITKCQTFRWWRRSWNGSAEVAETTVERLLCCGFRRTGKAMGQVYQCWWWIWMCGEINIFFPVSSITCFTFHIHLWFIYWLSLVLTLLFLIKIAYFFQYVSKYWFRINSGSELHLMYSAAFKKSSGRMKNSFPYLFMVYLMTLLVT